MINTYRRMSLNSVRNVRFVLNGRNIVKRFNSDVSYAELLKDSKLLFWFNRPLGKRLSRRMHFSAPI